MRKMFKVARLTCLHFVVLLFSFLGIQQGYAQATIPPDGIAVTSGMNINENGYEVGKLSVRASYTSGTANVTITLPNGITMKPNSLVKVGAGTGTITNINQSNSVITFDIEGASGTIEFSLDKLISPEAHRDVVTGGTSYVLEDKVKIVQGGTTTEEKSRTYSYQYPVLSIRAAEANTSAVQGVNTGTFEVFSSGNGNAFDIYFTVEYLSTEITHNEISFNGTVLNPISQNGSKYIFKIEKSAHSSGNGLPNQGVLLVTHKYNVLSRCISAAQIRYSANWGESNNETDWYEISDNTLNRTVSSPEGTANIEITRRGSAANGEGNQTDYTKTYFTLKGGSCVGVGEVMGTMRVSYTNYGTNTSLASAIYNLTLYLREERHDQIAAFYRPDNFRIIPTSGTGAGTPVNLVVNPIPSVLGSNKIYKVDFSSLTADPDGPGGIEDLNNDGKFDDLASGQTFVVEYDLVKNTDFSANCVNTTYSAVQIIGGYVAYAAYSNMCGTKIKGTSTTNPLADATFLPNRSYLKYFGTSDASYAPATLYRGATPEEARFVFGASTFYGVQISNSSATGTNSINFRIQYKIKLPTAVKATNIKWITSDTYPGSNPPINPDPSSVTTGQDLVITAPVNNRRGYVTMDFEADCPTNSGTFSGNLEYEILFIDDYGRPQACPIKLVCGSKPITVVCGSDCGNDGPVMLSTTAERAENSYGWKDHTMQTRHTRATMPAYLLKRALYLDDIEVTAKGRQERGTANNLYYSFTTRQGVSLAPKQIILKFTSGTRSGTSQVLTSSVANVTVIGSGNTAQKRILWNLTSALGGQPLNADDTFEVKATYQVDANGGDVQATANEVVVADRSYFFMYDTDGTTERYCGNTNSPEFYVSNSYIKYNGLNGYVLEGCTPNNVGGYLIHLGRRFNATGTIFTGEFRPDRLMKQFSFTVPKSYSIQGNIFYVYTGINPTTGAIANQEKVLTLNDFVRTESGNNVIYTIQNTYDPATKSYKLPPGLIRAASYSAYIRVTVQASCAAKTNRTEYIDTNTEFYDYFHHYGLNTPYGTAHSGTPTATEGTHQVVQFNNKPSVSLSAVGNTTLSVATADQELKVKLTNTNANQAAPYTWLSIPDVTGVEVLGLYDGSTLIGKVATVTGESMFYLSTAGLAVGQVKEYSVRVRLTNCSTATLKMYSGWNCNTFPTGYNQTCSSATDSSLSPSEVSFTLNYSGSEVQLSRITTPYPDPSDPTRARLHMCEDNWYVYEINSAKPGDVLEPQMSIAKEVGITISSVEIFYPYDSPTPSVVTGVDNGTALVYNLLPSGQVLPGTASSPGENNRKVKVRINVRPDCDFRGGSTFGLEVIGKNSCGGPLDGARDNAITAGVEGANSLNYTVNNTLSYVSGDANNCSTGAIYEGEHKIVANPGNSSGSNGKVVLYIPQGFDIVPNTFTVTGQSDTFASAVVLENPNGTAVPSGGKEYLIKIPDGMYNDDWFKYRIVVKQPDGQVAASCTAVHKIAYYTIDVVTTVNCPTIGGFCSNMTTITAPAKNVDITANRAVLEIRNLAVTSEAKNGKEELSYTFNIENTSATAYDGVLKISLYDDVNNNGQVDAGDNFVEVITLPSQNFAANTTVSGLSGKIELDQSDVCRLIMKVEASKNNCLCDTADVTAPAPDPISGLVENMTVCQTETKELVYNTNAPTYVSYRWTSTDATAMNYLSANNISNPTFKYTGNNLASAATFVYTLTVRRTDGCESSQQVNVVVNPAPAGPAATPQTFCGNATVQDLLPNSNVVWYSTATSETPLNSAQAIYTGVYYVASTSGACESLRTAVNVTVEPMPVAPAATAQTLCEGATVQNLLPNGTNILWYDTPTGGTALSSSVVLTTRKYYVVNSSANCESDRTEVDVTITQMASPIAKVTQPTCTSATGSVELTGLPSGNWTINYAGGSISGSGTSYTISGLNSGIHTLTVTNAAGCVSPIVSAYVSDPPVTLPDATYRVIPPVCGTTTGTVIFENLPASDWRITYGALVVTGTTTSTVINNLPIGSHTFVVTYLGSDKGHWIEDFGTGAPVTTTDKGTVASTYTFNSQNIISDGHYSIAQPNVFRHSDSGAWHTPPADHSGLANGRYLGINLGAVGGVGTIYSSKIENVVSGEKIKVSFARFNLLKWNGQRYRVQLEVYDNPAHTGTPIYQSPEISDPNLSTGEYWKVFESPAFDAGNNTELYFVLKSNSAETNGNDILIDDIQVFRERICSHTQTITTQIVGDTTPPVLTVPTELTVVCSSATATTAIEDWLAQATATDTCSVTVTNNYDTVKPTDLCNTTTGVVTVTFTATDEVGNVVTRTSTIRLTSAPIDAVDETFPPVNGKDGGSAGNVLTNDTLNGQPITDPTKVTITTTTPATPINGGSVPVLNTTTGEVTVPADTPAGTYTIVYKICEALNSTNCDTATATVVVTPPTLAAVPDTYTGINGGTGSTTTSVLTNDKLNGVPVNSSTVSLTVGTFTHTGIVMNPDGTITISPNTPAGTYTTTYTICDKINVGNCTSTTATVEVVKPTIDAIDDDFGSFNGAVGGTTSSVLNNDWFNGTQGVTTSTVTLTPGVSPHPNITMDANGVITITSGTPSGTYTYPYTICDKINGTDNCDTATATIVVVASNLIATPNNFTVVGGSTTTTTSVLTDDTLSGVPVNSSTVSLTVGTFTPTGITMNPDGTITVDGNTPAGTYTTTYKICEIANPTNCEDATVTVTVTPPVLVAVPDAYTGIDGATGGTTTSVLTNDTLNGVPVTPGTVSLTVGTFTQTGIVMNPDGTITISPNTPAGTYTTTYTICDKINAGNCTSTTATVVVVSQRIKAQDDNLGTISGSVGGVAGNVLGNNGNGTDTLGTAPATTASVTISQTIPAIPVPGGNGLVPTLDPVTGDVIVPVNTPAGTYTLTYSICEKLNAGNCSEAVVELVVTSQAIVAQDDDYTTYPVYTIGGGTPTTTSILVNDTISGTTATLATVVISNVTSPNANISIDTATGLVQVLPNTPAGIYTLTYQICEVANTLNCSNIAKVTVVVLDVPKANDDSVTTEINTPVTIEVLANDENVPTSGSVTVINNPSKGMVYLNDGGTPSDPSDDTFTYTPEDGFVGVDTFVYELCDAAGNCTTATVTIDVVGGGDIVPYNAISINDDGSNDVFYIKGIESYPNNTVRIYNRWGVMVFEMKGYNNTTKAFRGISNGRVTIEAPEKLPQGTYYYVIEYMDRNNQLQRKASWLYIKH